MRKEDNSERMPDEWETVPDEYKPPHPKDEYPIESEFTDGSERARADNGEYMSLSMAIVETYSEYNNLTPKKVAKKFDVSQTVAEEHLTHVRKVYGPNDSDPAENIQQRLEENKIQRRENGETNNEHSY